MPKAGGPYQARVFVGADVRRLPAEGPVPQMCRNHRSVVDSPGEAARDPHGPPGAVWSMLGPMPDVREILAPTDTPAALKITSVSSTDLYAPQDETITFSVAMTDGDGDVQTDDVAIGALISFEDDGPTASIDTVAEATASVDETDDIDNLDDPFDYGDPLGVDTLHVDAGQEFHELLGER